MVFSEVFVLQMFLNTLLLKWTKCTTCSPSFYSQLFPGVTFWSERDVLFPSLRRRSVFRSQYKKVSCLVDSSLWY